MDEQIKVSSRNPSKFVNMTEAAAHNLIFFYFYLHSFQISNPQVSMSKYLLIVYL